MQIVLLYENEKLKLFNDYKMFDKIKNMNDRLIEQIVCTKDTTKPQGLVLYVYEENEKNAFYKIKVFKDQDNFVHNFKSLTSITNYNNITNVLSEVLLMIYNYKKIIISDILVKDENGNKMKPNMTFYYQQINIDEPLKNLKFMKKHNFGSKKNSLDDTAIECYSDNEILLDLLSQQDLYFTTNENEYALFVFEDLLYLKTVTNNKLNDSHTVFDHATNKMYKRSIANLFENYKNVDFIKHCKDAFCNEIFRDQINEKYNKFVKKLENEEININNNNLFALINGLPCFTDHRKRYYDKLLSVFIKREKSIEKEVISKNAYLTAYEQKTIDQTPFGSLKNFIYKQ